MPETLGTTFAVDEVAIKVWESLVSTSVSERVTDFAVSSSVDVSATVPTTGASLTALTVIVKLWVAESAAPSFASTPE